MMQQRFGTFVCKLFRYPKKDADSLLAELEPPTLADAPAAQAGPPPKCQVGVPPSHLHSIPLEVSEEKLDGGTSFPESDPDEDFWKDPPSPFETK